MYYSFVFSFVKEEKLCDQLPPLVESINKMKMQFENTSEYISAVRPLLLHEIWSKISESYNTKLHENPSLEQCLSEKSLNKYEFYILIFEGHKERKVVFHLWTVQKQN